MKKKTLVCQFASPLDVDLHSKPESVVLEGKYWKRNFGVIKAEYMKWRKFYRNHGLGNNAILDTVEYSIELNGTISISDQGELIEIHAFIYCAG